MIGEGAVVVRWRVGGRQASSVLAANLSAAPMPAFRPRLAGCLWREGEAGDDGIFGPWAVRWSIVTAS